MDLQELAAKIELAPAALQQVEASAFSLEQFALAKKQLNGDLSEFAKSWPKTEEAYRNALVFYLLMALDAHKEYQRQGIAEQVFIDSFKDISIWCDDFYQKHGYYGLSEIYWLGLSAQMKVVRLGRLQFEPMQLEEEIVCAGVAIPRGARVLNVHIPAGEPLLPSACRESLKQARDFFAMPDAVFICDSWLLSPEVKNLLTEDSNIVRFQSMFQIVKVHHSFRQAEERVFGRISDDVESYPENTSLQRSLKAYLRLGKEPGIALGIIA